MPLADIDGVVFDMGGVLTVDPYAALRDYAVTLQIPEDTLVGHVRGSRFAEVETGALSMRDFLKFACRGVEGRFGVRVDIRLLAEALAAGQQVRPEMVELIGELVSNGVKVGLLTNNAKEARAWWASGVLPLEFFTAVVDSSDVGVRKPDPRIFVITADRLGCPPERVMFFDDTPENVAGAQAVGMIAELFTDPESCRRTCTGLGLIESSGATGQQKS
ncbi:HAD-superfamily hydrolase subfamily IA variant 3 [uncultured Mycobacterium sp.]|uniref:HAD-superfamily hydrolase subfamily IA variant 3 n=1 Tax=uncultured Mycobacterium sp. TaxID=171292 RepID=A0A1Y5PTA6_9MYCO|nr:HAD-superfamily hydrolase subfamily IA variant 3 [uncultured Mycobacterium sp.]